MSKYVLDHDLNKTLTITSKYEEWDVPSSVKIAVTAYSDILVPEDIGFITLSIDGKVLQSSSDTTGDGAVAVFGSNNSIAIGQDAEIHGVGIASIYLAGDDNTMSNDGKIYNNYVQGYGIAATETSDIVNNGLVQSVNYGVAITGGTMKNLSLGVIKGSTAAVAVGDDSNSQSIGTATIINDGTISSANLAIDAHYHSNSVKVIDHGSITGDIILSNYNDLIDVRRDQLSGEISGLEGDDVYIVSSQTTHITELAAGGTDTVKATASYLLGDELENLVLLGKANLNGTGNTLGNNVTGNAGANALDGGAGVDYLDGGKGADLLTGGLDADRFVFHTGDGIDTVTDFTMGEDYIEVDHVAGYSSFADLSQHITQHGANTWIEFDHGQRLVLDNVTANTLTANDFEFKI
jgi:Ca2+-binding RTX toxin-like protein